MKKIFCLLLLFVALIGVSFHQAAAQHVPTSDQHELLMLRLKAGQAQMVAAKMFEAFAMSEVEDVEVRFFQKEGWTAWQQLEHEEEDIPGSELRFVAPTTLFDLRAERNMSVQVTLIRLKEMPLQFVQADGITADVGIAAADDGDEVAVAPKIIFRREWGADESLGVYTPKDTPVDSSAQDADIEAPKAVNICAPLERAYPGQYQVSDKEVDINERGESLVWPREYSANVKKIVIHHTAQSVRDFDNDGGIDSQDYKTAVQAIYVYHTLTRKWGDLGYHYLVDPAGNIYEGRAGGKGVIGAQVLCQNSNTIGVSVMGNFEEENFQDKTFVGLVKIVKYLTDLYRINPAGKSSFRGEVLPNIVTHAEIGKVTAAAIGQGATKCPGENLKLIMPRLRKVVAEGGIKPDYGFSVVSVPKGLKLDPLQTSTVTIRLKNIGEQTWKKIELSAGAGKSGFLSKDLLSVGSDQETDIVIPISTDLEDGTTKLSFTVELDGQRQKKKVEFSYKVNKPVYRYELVSFDGKQDVILLGEKRTVTVKLKNTSNFPWLAEGKQRFQLRQVNRRDAALESLASGVSVALKETVLVGQEATFTLDLPVAQRPGKLKLDFIPTVAGSKGLKGERIAVTADLQAPKFAVDIAPVERRVRVEKGFSTSVDFQITNRSNFNWENGMVWYQVDGGDRQVIAQSLARGKSIVFPVQVRAGYEDRMVDLEGKVGIDHSPSYITYKGFKKSSLAFQESLLTTGTVRLSAAQVKQSRALLPPERGQYQEWVEISNTSNVPWYREGVDRIVLVLRGNADFADRSWEENTIAGFLEKEVIKPGETGKFLITLNVRSVPKRTTYDEFSLMVGNPPSGLGRAGKTVKLKEKVRFGVEIKGTKERREQVTIDQLQDPSVGSQNAQLAPVNSEIPPMRVWLSEAVQDEFQISSPGKFVFWDSKTVQIREQTAEQVVTIRVTDLANGTVIRLKAKDAPYLQFSNWDREKVFGSQRYNDNRYRGVLEFRLVDNKMTVINELSLEEYMKGVAEVPETDDQPTEKRKVIAVLARSYALHYLISGYEKFPGLSYNAADSPAIFQKYLGYSFEARSPKWQQVLIDTAGEVVMVGKDVLRAAYFSCTDGPRTKSWDEVWGDNEYFQKFGEVFQSVDDPLGDDPTREGLAACGHQVGLSGYGATQMAAQGETYRDIIQYYYQGVDIRQAQSP